MQAVRIQQLEALLGYQAAQSTAAPLAWQPDAGTFNPFAKTAVPRGADLIPLQEHRLEVMRPSPEPETRPLIGAFYESFPASTGTTAFVPSPTNVSTGSASANDLRRSSSISTSISLDGRGSGNKPSPLDAQLFTDEDTRGRGRHMNRYNRKESDADIQLSMSSMDLDAMFGGGPRVEEDSGGMRW
jgi:hypothetical protein